MTSRDMVFLTIISAAPQAAVWHCLIRPDLWFGPGVRLEPVLGGMFHEPWRDQDGEHHTRGRVSEFDAPNRLALTWRDDDWRFETEVRVELGAVGAGTRIALTHAGWAEAPDDERARLMAAHAAGWQGHLESLARAAEA